MADMQSPAIVLGDPVPWFGAPLLGTGSFHLQVAAGRWIVLSFLGSPTDPRVERGLELLRDADLFDSDKLIFCGVLTSPPADPAPFLARSTSAIAFMADYDGAISRSYGAGAGPRTIVLDPMLRAIANVAWDDSGNHASAVRDLLRSLQSVDDSAGVPLTAPILIIPRVFDFPLCETLVQFYDKIGGQDSGFLVDVDAKTAQVVDYRMKRRNDLLVAHPVLREAIRDQIVRRLLPPVERFFQFQATRMDRYIVACYDSQVGGHFQRHRDNENIGAQHRRFAVSINLNADFDGGEISFPEYSPQTFKAAPGTAVVFSGSILHQVSRVTRGRRYVFLTFLFDEDGERLRQANLKASQEAQRQPQGAASAPA
jgi:predicted 2-oxoglutarate/Fe(II)-dependent dioxygenase YbiX